MWLVYRLCAVTFLAAVCGYVLPSAIDNLTVDELKVVLKYHGESWIGAKEISIGRAHRMML